MISLIGIEERWLPGSGGKADEGIKVEKAGCLRQWDAGGCLDWGSQWGRGECGPGLSAEAEIPQGAIVPMQPLVLPLLPQHPWASYILVGWVKFFWVHE